MLWSAWCNPLRKHHKRSWQTWAPRQNTSSTSTHVTFLWPFDRNQIGAFMRNVTWFMWLGSFLWWLANSPFTLVIRKVTLHFMHFFLPLTGRICGGKLTLPVGSCWFVVCTGGIAFTQTPIITVYSRQLQKLCYFVQHLKKKNRVLKVYLCLIPCPERASMETFVLFVPSPTVLFPASEAIAMWRVDLKSVCGCSLYEESSECT